MTALLQKIANRLPQGRITGRIKDWLRRPLAASHPAWKDATYTITMADSRVKDWELHLTSHRDRVKDILEIGSYEGQSALFWLWYFPGAKVTCVDRWAQDGIGVGRARTIEARFDRNVGSAVRKLKMTSDEACNALRAETFDLIYVDGDHSYNQVLADSAAFWERLREGGVMIWDDCEHFDPQQATRVPVEAFLKRMQGSWRLVADTGQQMMVERIA